MALSARISDNPINWSFRIGRLWGITIRVHLLFILGALFVLGRSFYDAKEGLAPPRIAESLGTIVMLFAIVLLHEFGHCWGARRTGGEADEILMWPLGGLASVRCRHTARAHLITALAGPAVNVVLCGLAAVALVALHGGLGAVPWNPFQPFLPVDPNVDWADAYQRWLRILFSLSLTILLFNLVPMYPLDGGRVFQAWLWPRRGYAQAMLTATLAGMIGAIAMAALGLLTSAYLLLAIAFFGYVSCHQDRQRARYALESGDTSVLEGEEENWAQSAGGEDFAEPTPGFLARRRQARAETRAAREAQRRAAHEQQVDAILEKVHRHGLGALSRQERRLLETETRRQRRG